MSIAKYAEYSEQDIHSNTTWYNPTQETIYAKIWRGPETALNPWFVVRFLPGKETIVSSEYDKAIQVVDSRGTIIAGKCPQLVKVGETRKLHPALDANLAEKQQAFEQAQAALAQRAVAEQAAILAAGKLAMQENVKKVDKALDEFKSTDEKDYKTKK